MQVVGAREEVVRVDTLKPLERAEVAGEANLCRNLDWPSFDILRVLDNFWSFTGRFWFSRLWVFWALRV